MRELVKPETRVLDKETGELIITPAIYREVRKAGELTKQLRAGVDRPFFKTPYNHNRDAAARASATQIQGKTMTQQAEAEGTNINFIMKQYTKTGLAPGARRPSMGFLDVPDDLDMQSALHLVKSGYEEFERLPAMTRALFRNDMTAFTATVEHLRDTKQWDRLEALGFQIDRPKAPPEPTQAPPQKAEEQKSDGKQPPAKD